MSKSLPCDDHPSPGWRLQIVGLFAQHLAASGDREIDRYRRIDTMSMNSWISTSTDKLINLMKHIDSNKHTYWNFHLIFGPAYLYIIQIYFLIFFACLWSIYTRPLYIFYAMPFDSLTYTFNLSSRGWWFQPPWHILVIRDTPPISMVENILEGTHQPIAGYIIS